MKRVKLILSFDGTGLHGFQVQNKEVSVQGELNRAFQVLCKGSVPVCGCSRTDAGVHARRYHCHADLPDTVKLSALAKSLNALLPDSIRVYDVSLAPEDYHARYSVKEKTYRYYFWNAPCSNPLLKNRAAWVRFALDLETMKKEASSICGTRDFAAFQSAGAKKLESTVRTVSACRLDTSAFPLCFLEITADGFLYHMVRNIAGTLIQIGRGKETRFMETILCSEKEKALYCAPACGLYLWNVEDRA